MRLKLKVKLIIFCNNLIAENSKNNGNNTSL